MPSPGTSGFATGATAEYASTGDARQLLRGGTRVTAVVLAGTHRWEDSSFAQMRGPLVPVGLAPLIRYPLTWLRDAGITDVTICANSSTPRVRAALGDGDAVGMALDYYEDHFPRGAAGCVRDAALASGAETIVVVEGALIPAVDLVELLAAHRRSGAAATAVTEIDRRRTDLTRARPRTPGGIYVFERAVLDMIPPVGYQDIKEGLLERLYRAGWRVATHEVQGVAPRVIDYASYMAVNRWMIDRIARGHTLVSWERRGDALLHPTARVAANVALIGPVLVGPGVRMEPGTVVIGPTAIGADSRIDSEALVSRSVLWRRSTVGARALVDSSLLADDAEVVAGRTLVATVHPAQEPRAGTAPLAERGLATSGSGDSRSTLRLVASGVAPRAGLFTRLAR